MTEIRNNKQKNKKNGFDPCLEFVIWNLRFIYNLVLGICDFSHKTPRRSRKTLTPAIRDRHGPSKIPHCGEGPGFSGQNKN